MRMETIADNKLINKDVINFRSREVLFFYICIIDVLFFPYIRILSSSISMLVLPIWYVFNFNKLKKNKEFSVFILISIFMLVSLALSLIIYPGWVWKSNLSNFGILFFALLYYFFFKYMIEKYTVKIKKILIIYVGFVLILAIVYLVNPSLYFQMRSFWTMGGNVIAVESSLLIHRFTSTFSDPNNAATALVGVLAYLLFNEKIGKAKSILLVLGTGIIVLATMSSTGFIVYGLTLTLLLLILILSTRKIREIKFSTLFSSIFILLLVPFIYLLINLFFNTEVAQLALSRFSENSTESRINIWLRLLENQNIFKYIVVGMGGTIFVEGSTFRPHNGHLYLIYNYGMIVYFGFLYIFFRRRRTPINYYFFIIPFLIGFTMNVGISEPRFANLLALLVAAYAHNNYKLLRVRL